jgi:hypothetical protein
VESLADGPAAVAVESKAGEWILGRSLTVAAPVLFGQICRGEKAVEKKMPAR